MCRGLLLALLLTMSTGFALPVGPGPDLGGIRSLYLAAVEDEHAIARGLREVERLRARTQAAPGSPLDGVLTAYRGALVTLRARHARWPPARLRHLRDGLRILDAAVAAHPGVAEVRYLRLMSCYYLPGVLGRGGTVREDFDALARLLPGAGSAYPDELYRAILRFVLERGALSPERRAPLEAALEHADEK